MDKQTISKYAFAGLIAIVCVAMVCATIIQVRGLQPPVWLMTIVGSIGLVITGLLGWLSKSPLDGKDQSK